MTLLSGNKDLDFISKIYQNLNSYLICEIYIIDIDLDREVNCDNRHIIYDFIYNLILNTHTIYEIRDDELYYSLYFSIFNIQIIFDISKDTGLLEVDFAIENTISGFRYVTISSFFEYINYILEKSNLQSDLYKYDLILVNQILDNFIYNIAKEN